MRVPHHYQPWMQEDIVRSWQQITDSINGRIPKRWKKSAYATGLFHALVTVLGLQTKPLPFPLGPVGILVFILTGNPWLWILSSSWTWAWYWLRERAQHGGRIRVKDRMYWDQDETRWIVRTFSQRWDPVFDVLFPGIALAVEVGILVTIEFGGVLS